MASALIQQRANAMQNAIKQGREGGKQERETREFDSRVEMSRRASQQKPGGVVCVFGEAPKKQKHRNSDSDSTLRMCQAVVPTECGFTSAIINRVYVVVRCKNTACSEIRNPGRALASSAVALWRGAREASWVSHSRSYCSLRLTIGSCENRVCDLGRSAILGSRTRVLDYKIPTCPLWCFSGLV